MKMHSRGLIFWLILSFYQSEVLTEDATTERARLRDNLRSTYSANDLLLSDSSLNTCSIDDFACLTMAANDRIGLEAIKTLHQKLDDDANGNVDLSESDDFLREELQYDSGYERRQKAFHRNDDMHISVKELWEAWLKSEVHNWTVEQTTDWLVLSVDLPQYVPNFIMHKVTGANLPRLAANNVHYLNHLGIKDPIHKQKIVLKAMDVVLFGPPKDQPHWKDLTLIVLIIGGGIGVWYAFHQNKKFKTHLNRMNRDMDSLQNAEKALENLQKELEEAKQAQVDAYTEKENLAKKLQDSKTDLDSISTSYSDLEVTQLKAEIEMLRTELQIAEGELKDRCWSPPAVLQYWLQLTHELENKSYLKKKIAAEKQLQQAREACEKLRKKRSSLVGAFVSTHGKSIDEVDRSIVEARTSLNEVTQELQERVLRWKQIELLSGFNIINNNGLQFLENTLYRNSNGRALPIRGRISSQNDLDDDTGSIYGSHQGPPESAAHHSFKEGDSSGSEASRQEDEPHSEYKTQTVHFMVGGEISTWPEDSAVSKPGKLSSNPRSISNNNIAVVPRGTSITRSYSQDVNVGGLDLGRPKSSQSDTSLDAPARPRSLRQTPIKELPASSMEDDICSTDSSLMDEDIKKKKKKLFMFVKKSKGRSD